MTLNNRLKRKNVSIGVSILLVSIFMFFFSVSQENKTLAQMDKNYQSSDTYKKESLLDRARFVTERDGEATIVVLGSSVTFGKGATEEQPVWGNLLETNLNEVDGIKAKVINRGYSGYSTADLISKNKIEAVIKDKPDIILFELCLINNNRYPQNEVSQTKSDIQLIMDTFNKQLPGTLVILQTANPTIYNNVFLDQGKVTYGQYNDEIAEYVRANQWPFIDTYQLMLDSMNEQHLTTKDVLSDHVHPNGDGYSMWFKVLKNQLDVPVKMLH
ncbi:SGNH/GDSL hydrolase family protein [Carnobacterium sp.]|uniref:SGNH/GDSL hydrolase family protein n=1 Tax=Carnobacterium sp. TaxID=48221 RepID=UPI0028A6308A|nr:SGNH/GDSL hydrolase family protein [Carnobacterium sp.]